MKLENFWNWEIMKLENFGTENITPFRLKHIPSVEV